MARLRFSGGALILEGVVIKNIPPCTGELLTIRSLKVVPSLRIAGGRPSLALLELNGGTVELNQDSAKEWNITPLLLRLKNRPGGSKNFIQLLSLRETSLKINGHAIPSMEITIRNLATGGSRDATWRIGFTSVQ